MTCVYRCGRRRFALLILLPYVAAHAALAAPMDERMSNRPSLPKADRPLKERFSVPPAESRILKIIHILPDEPERQDEMIRTLFRQGFGGFVTNVSFEKYLESEDKWQAFIRAVNIAKDAGMCLWLYDERGYPSGVAGGLVLRDHPEWEARGLFVQDAITSGGPVTLEAPPGILVRAVAFAVADGKIMLDSVMDLSTHVREGKLTWEAPAGSWRVMLITESRLYDGTHAAVSLADKLPYINLLMPEPTARFIEVTHAEYARRLGNDLGAWFAATFTDEPSLMSMFMHKQPYRPLPWSPNLPHEFQKRRGYALEPLVPALIADAGPNGQRYRYDFWETVGDLVAENFFGQIQTWCRLHNIPSGGHLLVEEPLLPHVPLYGDFFRCARRLDTPSIDCLTSVPEEVPWHIARLISSIAELEGRELTMCETSDHSQRYRPQGDTRPVREVTEDEIRGTCNRLILNGITTITSYYSFTGLTDAQLVRLNEWIGRCCTMLRGGHQVSDIALLYPIESVWPKFVPSSNWVADCPPAAHQVEKTYRETAESLYASRRDFTYVDSRALAEAQVRRGVLRHGKLQWRAVVLPCADTMPLQAWRNLARFWRSGGLVIAAGTLPANSETEFPSPEVQELAKEIFGDSAAPRVTASKAGGAGVFLPLGSEGLLSSVLDSLLEPDVRVVPQEAPLRVTHRRRDGHEVYFLINDSRQPWKGDVILAAKGNGEQWDPATGAVRPSDAAFSLDLEPFDAMLFRFPEARPRARRTVPSGPLRNLQCVPLPEVQPSVGKGEFVEAKVTQAAAFSATSGTAWQAAGRITRGNVDTFLFLMFDFPEPFNIHHAYCLKFDALMPKGQRTPSELLVILQDAEGREHLASTGIPLNASGRYPCFVPISRFHRAGWNTAPEGNLDLAKITSVRIGWGGYHGTEGEQITFSISFPVTCKRQDDAQ